jgi:LysR family transcriptional regulator, hydrogen peroxide-inducible genes activator
MERPSPTLRQIEAFLAVGELTNFRRAAEQLRISQPTLTHQIASLEAAVGVRLFERSRSGTVPTAAGRDLIPNARRVVEELRALIERAESFSRGPSGTYRLGVTPTLGPYLLPHILPTLHRRYSALRLSVREGAPRMLEAGLGRGEHDVILTTTPVEEPRLTIFPLFHELLKLVLPADHPLAGRERIECRDLRGESILTIEEHHHFHHQIVTLCERLGAHVRRDYLGTTLDTLRHMVVMGMGLAFLPTYYVRSEIHRPSELRVTQVADEVIERTHVLAWRASSPSAQLFREIAEEIRGVVARDGQGDLRVASIG